MNDPISLRDEWAMSAPLPRLNPDDKALPQDHLDEWMRDDALLRYRYADIALRVKAETMPKAEVKHPEWAKWAARGADNSCWYFECEPVEYIKYSDQESGWIRIAGQYLKIEGDTSWIPTNWRQSKVKL